MQRGGVQGTAVPCRNFVIWIRKNETPEWNFPGSQGKQEDSATYDFVTANQFHEALIQISEEGQSNDELPFQIYDCREQHEREIFDLADEFDYTDKNTGEQLSFPLNKVNLDLYELQTGYFLEQNFKKDQWILCLCQLGLKSGQAHRYLTKKGYNSKILLGGLDALPKELLKF